MKPAIALCLALLLLASLLSACGNKTPSDDGMYTGWIASATVEDEGVTLSCTMEPTDPFVDGIFTVLSETPASEFTYTTGERGATVTGYVGEEKNVRIPATLGGLPVTAIADEAFVDAVALEALYIPDSVTSLGKDILCGAEKLRALHTPLLGANVTSTQFLGYLFGSAGYADHLRDVPSSLYYLEIGEGLTKIPAYALYECKDLLGVLLPSTVKTVEKFAFYNAQKMDYINLDALETIGEYAFAGCESIHAVLLGTSLQTIGRGAFEGCSPVRMDLPFVGGSRTENRFLGYIFGADVPDFNAGFVPAALWKVQLLEGCTSIAPNAFFECSSIRYLTLPSTLTSIGTRAFGGCTRLREITLPDACTTVGANAFYGCFGLRRVTLGEGLSSLGINAFYYCISLSSVQTPATLQEIPASAFAGCRALSSVTLTGVTSVGKNAFRGCEALATASLPSDAKIARGNDALTDLLEK